MHPISRRNLVLAATGISAAAVSPRLVFAQAKAPAPAIGPFTLPALTYPVNALEPHIDVKSCGAVRCFSPVWSVTRLTETPCPKQNGPSANAKGPFSRTEFRAPSQAHAFPVG